MALNRAKFRNLVHYVCFKCDDASILGATKLNKVLWYSDVISYVAFGHSITNETYIKQQFGPVPKDILRAIDELEDKGALVVRDVAFFGKKKKEYIAMTEPDLSKFEAREISLIDQVIDFVCKENTATSISRETHDYIWGIAAIGEELPYETAFVSEFGDIDESDINWAKGVVEEIEKEAA